MVSEILAVSRIGLARSLRRAWAPTRSRNPEKVLRAAWGNRDEGALQIIRRAAVSPTSMTDFPPRRGRGIPRPHALLSRAQAVRRGEQVRSHWVALDRRAVRGQPACSSRRGIPLRPFRPAWAPPRWVRRRRSWCSLLIPALRHIVFLHWPALGSKERWWRSAVVDKARNGSS
jgi:hypothetical protein